MIRNDLRAKVRDSILAGVSDALTEIEGHATGNGDTGNALALLRARLAPALPAPAAEALGVSEEAAEPPDGPTPTSAPRKGRKRSAAAG
jgi:hypothetical protein